MPSIAVIGASPDRRKFGNKAVRAYAEMGWEVFPVNPRATEIEGLKSYPSLDDVPAQALDRVSLYLPPSLGLPLLEEIARRPVGELWLNPGTESSELVAKAGELGLNAVRGCSIVDIGVDPHHLSDS